MHNRRALHGITGRRAVPICVRTALVSNGVVPTVSRNTSRSGTPMSTPMQYWMKLRISIAGPQPSGDIRSKHQFMGTVSSFKYDGSKSF